MQNEPCVPLPRVWRIFALLNGIGVLLATFGIIDDPIRQAFIPVGGLLLMPGFLVSVVVAPHLADIGARGEVLNFLAALPAVAFNFVAWHTFLRVTR